MNIGQRVAPEDGRSLKGNIVEIFATTPPHPPTIAVIWDHDKTRERRWFPTRQLKLIEVPAAIAEPPQKSSVRFQVTTWAKEALVVGSILLAVALAKGQAIELLGALAVLLSFMHAQVSFRHAEASRKSQPQVSCHWIAQYYFLGKEACWFSYFLCLGAWSALIGVLIFLIYPVWRKYNLGQKHD